MLDAVFDAENRHSVLGLEVGDHGMSRSLCRAVGAVGYAAGMAALVLFILFAGGWRVGPFWIDRPPRDTVGMALVVDLALVAIFGAQHTVMARPWFKRWWTRVVPQSIERSVYCIATALAICLLCSLWQPLPGVVWTTDVPAIRVALTALQLIGWGVVVASSFMISHTELFGLRQAGAYAAGRPDPEPALSERGLYRYVRHPLQMGVLIGLWATPHMSTSHMFFAAMLSAYVLVGLHHEERDLVSEFGEEYLAYQRRTPMLLPLRWDASPARRASSGKSAVD